MSAPDYPYYQRACGGWALPLAFVDLDLLAHNAAAVARRAAGKPVRIATKSVRCVALLRRLLELSPGFRGLMCMTPAEAVYLAGAGFDDLLVAYPSVDAEAIAAAARVVASGKRLLLTADCAGHVERLAAAARTAGVVLPVCLDVDLSWDLPGLRFGVYRSPIATPEQALEVAAAIRAQPSLRLHGVLAYEAQIAGVPDARGSAVEGWIVRGLKRASLGRVAQRRGAIVAALRTAGHEPRLVNGGGTGSLETTTAEDAVTELAAGSAFYAPTLFDGYRAFRHLPAAAFALQITRRPAPDVYTCHGGGYVASGAAGSDKLPRPYLPDGAALVPGEGAGEVQTPVRYRGPQWLELGDPIFFRHAKAGELLERFRTLLLVSGGAVVAEVPSYRGDECCFP